VLFFTCQKIKVLVEGEKVRIQTHNSNEVEVRGNIDAIYFITPFANQTVFPLEGDDEVRINFNGNSSFQPETPSVRAGSKV